MDDIQADRLEIARRFAAGVGPRGRPKRRLHGHRAPGWTTTTIPVATSALARAGSGDVLAGLIVGFRAQGVDAYDGRLGAWVHAQAGAGGRKPLGGSGTILAGDVLDSVVDIIAGL